jgi:two-component system LytT family response regulator
MINELHPELIFLDVVMEDMTGFEMLGMLNKIDFQTIFVTSYSDYAIRAIRFNALDYLLKPIDLEEIKSAILRYRAKTDPERNRDHVRTALQNMVVREPEEQLLIIGDYNEEQKLRLKSIIRLEGDRNYTHFHLTGGSRKLVAKSLVEYELLLSDRGFFRCHKSHMVNGVHIHSTQGKSMLLMSDGILIPVARRRQADFAQWYRTRKAGITSASSSGRGDNL